VCLGGSVGKTVRIELALVNGSFVLPVDDGGDEVGTAWGVVVDEAMIPLWTVGSGASPRRIDLRRRRPLHVHTDNFSSFTGLRSVS
jgi:hypothetical protein